MNDNDNDSKFKDNNNQGEQKQNVTNSGIEMKASHSNGLLIQNTTCYEHPVGLSKARSYSQQ